MAAVLAVKVREARLKELDALTELCLRSKKSNGYDDAFIDACRDELTVRKDWILHDDFWVAVDTEDKLVGCIRLEAGTAEGEGELSTCFIDPDLQGNGIGRKLFGELSKRAKDLGLKRLFLDADPAAQPFYERLGFTVIGRVPSGSIPGRTLPHMEMRLGVE